MKKIYLIVFCLAFCVPSFAQQFLWSTISEDPKKNIPLENVTSEVLKFYDHYKHYIDGSGYNKNTFFEVLEKYGGGNSGGWNDVKAKIKKIDELTVFALRGNSGEGSVVIVLFVTAENVNLVAFTNNYESGSQIIYPMESERRKFSKWIETLKD